MIETEAWLLPRNQHDSEASFVSHHPSVSFGGLCQRNGFDHRTDLLQGAKGKRVLGIYRRAGHRSRQRTHTEKEREIGRASSRKRMHTVEGAISCTRYTARPADHDWGHM